MARGRTKSKKKNASVAREKQMFALLEAFARVDDPAVRKALLTITECVASIPVLLQHARSRRAEETKFS